MEATAVETPPGFSPDTDWLPFFSDELYCFRECEQRPHAGSFYG
jgi:hypothetical protein